MFGTVCLIGPTVDFSSLTSFKRTINDVEFVDYSDFLNIFHCNVIIECFIFVLVFFSHIPLLWAVVSAVVVFLTLGAHVFIVHMLCFLCF